MGPIQLYYSGFNGFQQGCKAQCSDDKEINHLNSKSDVCAPMLLFEFEPNSLKHVFLSWSRMMIVQDNTLTVSGYWNGVTGFRGTVNCNAKKMNQVTCTEYLAVGVDEDGTLWKLPIGKTPTDCEWMQVSINLKDEDSEDEKEEYVTKFIKVSSNEHSVVALDESGHIYQLPLRIEDLNSRFVDVACGKEHFIALSSAGTVFSWGSGSRGQLGHGSVESVDYPMEIELLGGIKIVQIAAGGWHSCALSDSGDVYIWGWNESGQLGFPSRNMSGSACKSDEHVSIQSEPRLLDGVIPFSASDVNVTSIGCGARHTAVTLGDKSGWAWGWNGCGQLGTGDRQSHDTPVCVIQDVEKVVCGGWSTAWLSHL